LVSSALYWLTNGNTASARIVEPGDVIVLRGEARKSWKHGIARPKLNVKLPDGAARIITEHGSPRLELGVLCSTGQKGKLAAALDHVSDD